MLENPLFWLFAAPGLLLGLYAQSRIKWNYTKYSQVATASRVTGAEVARRLLDSQGLRHVRIETTPGLLSDHYDPRTKVLRLSQDVFYTPSIAAAGIAAHEAGHALQDADNYFPMQVRSFIVPLVQLAGTIAPWIFFGGFILGNLTIAWAGVALFATQTLFTLVTLPVEYDASARAQKLLLAQNIVVREENIDGLKKVLGAAAWTYVAGAVTALGTLLYFVAILLGRREDR
jgi:Zn-dependent membrane protease YugP